MKNPLTDAANVLRYNTSRALWLVVIVAVAVLLYLIRLSGGTDLESYGQPITIAHLLDLAIGEHLVVQRDLNGTLMATPPFHTWLMALSTAVLGFSRTALTVPSFISILAIALVVFEVGRRRFGELAGGLATVALLLSPATAKQIAIVGADPVFTLAVTAGALAACSAQQCVSDDKRPWLTFWLASAIATLTGGLPGVLLAAAGLLSYVWRTADQRGYAAPLQSHIVGVLLIVALVISWLIPAGLREGFGPTVRMLWPVASEWDASDLLNPAIALLTRFLPFSLFLFAGLWRQFRQPATNAVERGFERFLACWLICGLLIIALSRPADIDPVFALWPAGALLAGREMARIAERMGKTKFAGVAVVLGCILIGATYNAVHSVGPGNLGSSVLGQELQLARNAERAASALRASDIDLKALHHLATPKTLQFYLGTFRPLIDKAALDSMLASATAPVDLATGSAGIDGLGLTERFPGTRPIFHWPDDGVQPPVIQVYRIAR